jgi:MFS family permease
MHINGEAIRSKIKNSRISQHWMLTGLMLQGTMDLLDVGMFNVAMPAIQQEFNLQVEVLSLVVAVRYIARIGMMPIYGLIGDRLGKKRSLLAGMITFFLGGLTCLFAPTLTMLVVGRILLGIGGGILPLSMAIISDHFPTGQRGRILGIWNSASPVGTIIGPPLGGLVIEHFGWKTIFVLVGLGSLTAIALVLRLVPASDRYQKLKSPIDWFGAACLFTFATGLLMSTTTSSIFPFGSITNLAFWGITGIALLLMIWNGMKNPEALINAGIVKNVRLILPSVAMIFRMFALTGTSFLLVLYLSNVFAKSPSAIGLIMIFHSTSLFIGVPVGGMLADRWTCRKAAGMGMIIQTIGTAWLALISPIAGGLILIPGMILGGFGAGLSLTPYNKGAIASMGEINTGRAAGLYNMVRFTGSASSAPVLGLILAARFEQAGGLETTASPYQFSFMILIVCALISAGLAALIPPPCDETKVEDTISGEM